MCGMGNGRRVAVVGDPAGAVELKQEAAGSIHPPRAAHPHIRREDWGVEGLYSEMTDPSLLLTALLK